MQQQTRYISFAGCPAMFGGDEAVAAYARILCPPLSFCKCDVLRRMENLKSRNQKVRECPIWERHLVVW